MILCSKQYVVVNIIVLLPRIKRGGGHPVINDITYRTIQDNTACIMTNKKQAGIELCMAQCWL